MEQVGVEAVVKGLTSFVSDIGKLNSSLKSIEPSGNIVTRTLEGVSNAFSGLAGFMGRVAEVALGVLVRDAFNAIVNGLKEIISSTIEAGNEFQILGLRLERLNFNTAIAQSNNLEEATVRATKATREQLSWVQKLAATTPYDFQDIANVFTLARSYGFADTEAKGLTEDITDFAAGMGLGNTEIERIVVNMGQMVQQGKVTQREMNDLARGAFVPVNDVLKQMQKNTGLTGKAFDKFKSSTKGVNAFMTAFSQIVQQRFTGASEQMARTFKGATDNVKDFIKSIFGFGVVTPILDKVGGKIADVLATLTSPGNFAAISLSVQRFGTAISDLIGELLGLGDVDTGNITQRILQGFNRATKWIETHKDDIINFFLNVKDTIKGVFDAAKNGDLGGVFAALGVPQETIDKITGFKDTIVETFNTIKGWIDENKPTIDEFFGTLGEIVGTVIENLTGKGIDTSGGLQGLLDGITTFMQFVIDNKDKIADWTTKLLELWGALQLIQFVLSLIMPPILAVVGGFLGLMGAIIGFISVAAILFNPLTWLITAFALIGLGIGGLIGLTAALVENWDKAGPLLGAIWEAIKSTILDIFSNLVEGIANGFARWWELTTTNLQNIYQYFFSSFNSIADLLDPMKWWALGQKMIEGLTKGIEEMAGNFLATLRGIVDEAVELVETLLNIRSPSKVFAKIGNKIMQGLAEGILDSSGLAMGAMQKAIAGVEMPAVYASAQMGGAVSTQNNYTSNYNLTVNTSAPSEPIIQDYNMLQSLAGA